MVKMHSFSHLDIKFFVCVPSTVLSMGKYIQESSRKYGFQMELRIIINGDKDSEGSKGSSERVN